MYVPRSYYVHMKMRFTIVLDEELLARAKQMLGPPTT
jgi:Arc/MetJ family transcription regulator